MSSISALSVTFCFESLGALSYFEIFIEKFTLGTAGCDVVKCALLPFVIDLTLLLIKRSCFMHVQHEVLCGRHFNLHFCTFWLETKRYRTYICLKYWLFLCLQLITCSSQICLNFMTPWFTHSGQSDNGVSQTGSPHVDLQRRVKVRNN